jgi:hypothetical protein
MTMPKVKLRIRKEIAERAFDTLIKFFKDLNEDNQSIAHSRAIKDVLYGLENLEGNILILFNDYDDIKGR